MFSVATNTSELKNTYDFDAEENQLKWRGLLVNSLQKASIKIIENGDLRTVKT